MLEEPGADRVMDVIDNSEVHRINLTEVAKKLGLEGIAPAEAGAILDAMDLEVRGDWDRRRAYRAGELLTANKAIGLSLGDAMCLIEASSRGITAIPKGARPEVIWPSWPESEGLSWPDILLIR